jgi:hypothetical protein
MATLLIGSASLAATEDPAIEVLLGNVEQKVASDHTSSPAGDSAVDVWKQVIGVIPGTDPARVGNALKAFAIHMRRRADEEKKAGNLAVSEDMSVFASHAERLIANADMMDTLPGPPKYEPLAGSLPPIAAPRPASGAGPEFPQGPVTPSVAAFYAWRGDQMLVAKDLAAARRYFEFAAKAGNARAATALADTYEPGFEAQFLNAGHEGQRHNPRRHRIHVWRSRIQVTAPSEASPTAQ